MKKSILKAILLICCFLVFCCSAPVFAFAEGETYELYICGQQVTNENCGNIWGDSGSVVFEPSSNTLTLTDAYLVNPGEFNLDDEIAKIGIYCKKIDSLTIRLVGSNTIQFKSSSGKNAYGIRVDDNDAPLHFVGDGTLSVVIGTVGGSVPCCYGVKTCGNVSFEESAAVTAEANGPAKELCCGVSAKTVDVESTASTTIGAGQVSDGGLSVGVQGTITKIDKTRPGNSVFINSWNKPYEVMPLYINPGYTVWASTDEYTDEIPVEKYIENARTVDYSGVSFCSPTAFSEDEIIYVGGVKVGPVTANDVLGDGTVSYDEKENVLTLDNAKITNFSSDENGSGKEYGIYSKSYISIELIGDNVVDLGDYDLSYGGWGIFIGHTLETDVPPVVFGDGDLTIIAPDSAYSGSTAIQVNMSNPLLATSGNLWIEGGTAHANNSTLLKCERGHFGFSNTAFGNSITLVSPVNARTTVDMYSPYQVLMSGDIEGTSFDEVSEDLFTHGTYYDEFQPDFSFSAKQLCFVPSEKKQIDKVVCNYSLTDSLTFEKIIEQGEMKVFSDGVEIEYLPETTVNVYKTSNKDLPFEQWTHVSSLKEKVDKTCYYVFGIEVKSSNGCFAFSQSCALEDEKGELLEDVKVTEDGLLISGKMCFANGLRGDANSDGVVNMKDVLLLRKYLAEISCTINLDASDANGDGTVNMKDVLILRKYLAEIIDTLD